MEAIAKIKHLKGSPRKARLVIDMIRGRNVSQALAILRFTDKRAADPIEKCMRSAIANATFLAEKQNIAIDPDDLFVKSCFVDMGAHKNRRRMRPAPQGRAYREQRHYCHITILVSSDKPEAAEKDINQSRNGKEGDKSSGEKKTKASATSAGDTKAPDQKKKAGTVKETKKAKAEETVADETVTSSSPIEETKSPKATEASKPVVEADAQATTEATDAKDATSQTPAERHETKPADEAQLNTNEELERQ
jgi:large subunit ribosomal protein L22